MVEGLDTVWAAIQQAIPDVFIKRKFNFITIHYLYLGGMSFFWSAIVYAIGGMAYIDALFFTAGACTQSGLNTINVNDITTAQQAILYGLAMLCNPIVINTVVVFVRLYWFERRFQDVVKEARALRRTRSRSISRAGSRRKDDLETGPGGLGVRGRAIRLLRNTGRRAEGRPIYDEKDEQSPEKDSPSFVPGDEASNSPKRYESPSPRRRLSNASSQDVRLPQQMNPEQHISFLQNQLNPKDNTTLRIPSPREFDRGGRVQSIDESDESLVRQRTALPAREPSFEMTRGAQMANHITFNEPDLPRHKDRNNDLPRVESGRAATMDPSTYYDADPLGRGRSRNRRNSFLRTNTTRTLEATPYLSWQPTVARNSFFVNLNEKQREELGGIEYRALKTLALILLGYSFCFHAFGILCLTPWIYHHYGSVVTADGQGRAWWGVFTAGSSFNDLGFTLTPDSMMSFQAATFPLLVMTFLIIIGNTGFPCMLRFVIWSLSKCVPMGIGLWEELQFLLDHPRRCFTLLFPRAATWWLFAILVILNGVDLIFFIILDINNSVVDGLTGWEKFLDGLFQAASTRTAGFAVVNVANLHPAIQVSYLIMMYISVFPIAISMRRTNVYEEKSLGIYAGASEEEADEKEPSYVSAHLRKQLSFDLWYIFLGLFVVTIVEGSKIQDPNDVGFTIFAVLFEIVSAYGTVGLSLGYPNTDPSFSAQFSVLSKLVIVAMMIRGRHRGLPYELDRAILLPSESLQEKEAAEGEKIFQRRRSSVLVNEEPGDDGRFRPETGITSATDYKRRQSDSRPQYTDVSRQRRTAQESNTAAENDLIANHKSHLRTGIGVGMFKLVSAEESIKEGVEKAGPSRTPS